jgi:protein farnesyltransferase subunit beta
MYQEGGFQGRTNKLVDGCYSFWQGALFSLVDCYFPPSTFTTKGGINTEGAEFINKSPQRDTTLMGGDSVDMDRMALQKYILVCCQSPYGGLRDKPSK